MSHTLGKAILLAMALAACKTSGTVGDGSAVKNGGSGGSASGLALVAPGSDDNALNIPAVVQAMRDTKSAFYDKGDGYSQGQKPLYGEVAQCFNACPPYYSDLVCHFYCGYPSYAAVIPNVRGCFSYLAGGSVMRNDLSPARKMFYPEMYDYCLYQPYDKVKASEPAFDQQTIDANKAAGNKPGVLKWVDDNQRDVFRYVVFTYYNPFAFKFEDQQDALNEFYDVQLANKSYGAGDAADVAECNKKRPRTSVDPWDGTHCSYAKPRNRYQRHPDWGNIMSYLGTTNNGTKPVPGFVSATPMANANWRSLYTCENGSVVIDVDQNDTRRLQMVIRNGGMFRTFDRPPYDYNQIRKSNERIYQGTSVSGNGINSASDIAFFQSEATANNGRQAAFDVKRAGNDLRFRALNLSQCGGQFNNNDFPESCLVIDPSFGKQDYVFKNCR